MSKRTIIIGVVAVLAIIAALLSMYFEYKGTIDEANKILSGESEPVLKVVKKAKVKEPIKVEFEDLNKPETPVQNERTTE